MPSRYVELLIYADDTPVIATSVSQRCLSNTLRYLSNLERWLSEWRIAINTSKSSFMLFDKVGRHFPKPQPDQLLGEPIQWVDTARYLG